MIVLEPAKQNEHYGDLANDCHIKKQAREAKAIKQQQQSSFLHQQCTANHLSSLESCTQIPGGQECAAGLTHRKLWNGGTSSNRSGWICEVCLVLGSGGSGTGAGLRHWG